MQRIRRLFLAVRHGLSADPLYVLVPPLVSFLSGSMLTLGLVELAYGDTVNGSSRLITGFVQLVVLAFGLTAGAVLVGVSADTLIEAVGQIDTVACAPSAGVAV